MNATTTTTTAVVGQAATVHAATKGQTASGVTFIDTLCGAGRGRATREVVGATITCDRCAAYRVEL